MKFDFIAAEKAHFPVSKLCDVLGVSRSGFYASRTRPPSERCVQDAKLTVLLREAYERNRSVYGSPKLHVALQKQQVFVGRNRIIRLMQQAGLVGRVRRRYRSTTMSDHQQPIAANLLDRQFEASAPNQRWVGDTTELLTESGRLYLAVILDLFSRFVVGWAVSAMNNRHLTLKALDMALKRRCPDPGLLHHSDRGSTYASDDYQAKLDAHGITCSMSRRGNCYDNAAMESWFSTLKTELGERFEDATQAKTELFDYIEVFYNQQRMHSAIDYASPAEYERATQAA